MASGGLDQLNPKARLFCTVGTLTKDNASLVGESRVPSVQAAISVSN